MTAIRNYWRRAISLIADIRLVLGDGVRRLPLLLVLMLVMTAMDVLAVVAIAPFLARIVGSAAAIPGVLRELTDTWSLRMLGVTVVVAFTLKGLMILGVQRRITLIADGERARIMSRLMASYQARPYQFHLQHNSSELINRVLWYTLAFSNGVLQGGLQLIANGLVMLVLALLLAWTDLNALLVMMSGLALVFVVVATLVRPALSEAVQTSANINAKLIDSANQAIGGLREIRLLGREEYFRERLNQSAKKLVKASASQAMLSQLPRQVIEVSMVGFLVAMVWVMTREPGSMQSVIPVLGTFATAGLRLMPASTALLSSWNGLRSNVFAARALAAELRDTEVAPCPQREPVTDEKFEQLVLNDVHYRYPGSTRDAVRGISLRIERGQAIGIMGRSGAGKSSLADMILGLLSPTTGSIVVNDWSMADHTARWQAMTAYIPQVVFLIDDTLRRNIALGIADNEVDEIKLAKALSAAQLNELVADLPEGLETILGERGIRLSGGQRQRVAIARALYHQRQFLVLDEATSALDTETEQAVVDAINALAGTITLVVIAHRESTLSACGRIIRLAEGRIVEPSKLKRIAE